MAISTANAINEIAEGLATGPSRVVVDKAGIANAVAGQLISLWRATGQPAQGAIPGTTPALCTNATLGAIAFAQQTAPATSYLAWLALQCNLNAQTFEVHDRIAHMGGLVLNVTTSQAITGLDLDPAALNPPAARLGEANYSDGQWFLEVYADGGATAANATINVTFNDGTSNNLAVVAVGGTLRAGRMIPLTPQIQAADQGKFIRRINSVILSASTTVAGNFGFTYTRQRTLLTLPLANKSEVGDWASLGLSVVPNGSCLEFVCLTSNTSTGALRGQGKIIHV